MLDRLKSFVRQVTEGIPLQGGPVRLAMLGLDGASDTIRFTEHRASTALTDTRQVDEFLDRLSLNNATVHFPLQTALEEVETHIITDPIPHRHSHPHRHANQLDTITTTAGSATNLDLCFYRACGDGSGYDATRSCQCDPTCQTSRDCCTDYASVCLASSTGSTEPNIETSATPITPTAIPHVHAHFEPLVLFVTSSRTGACSSSNANFRCNDGMCIERDRVCDGNPAPTWPDCFDQSDEADCVDRRTYHQSSPRAFENEICIDNSTWRDVHGYSCAEYEALSLCTITGSPGTGWGVDWGTISEHSVDGRDATLSCCVCGGGNRSVIQNTADDLSLSGALEHRINQLQSIYGAHVSLITIGQSERYDLSVPFPNHVRLVQPHLIEVEARSLILDELCTTTAPTPVPTPAPTVIPTLAPSALPSASPTTMPSAAPTRTPCVVRRDYCHECANITHCSFCREARYLLDGRCITACPIGYRSIGRGHFRRRCEAIETGCADRQNHCHRCANSTTCSFCRDAHFLHNGQCIASCPAGYSTSGRGLYRKECIRQPTRGTSATRPWCVDRQEHCHRCGSATACQICRNAQYLYAGVCVPRCPPGLVEAGRGFYNRRCVPAGAATQGIATAGVCIDRRNHCHRCSNSSACSFCRDAHFLHEGRCIEECPDGYRGRGRGNFRKECEPSQ